MDGDEDGYQSQEGEKTELICLLLFCVATTMHLRLDGSQRGQVV
jgi:hypothetical protein